MGVYDQMRADRTNGHLDLDHPGEIALVLEIARQTGGPVLELACGAGRVMCALAEAGFKTVGIDSSRPMLRKGADARRLLPDVVQTRIQFVWGDMRCFEIPRRFPLIIIPFNSFWYNLNEADAERCIGMILGHLADGGRFLIESPGTDCTAIDLIRALQPELMPKGAWWGRMAVTCGFAFEVRRYSRSQEYATNHDMLIGWKI